MYKLAFQYTGGHDFAQILHQVYTYMYITSITIPFNSHTYSFTLWECFIVTLTIGLLVDLFAFGCHVIIRRY